MDYRKIGTSLMLSVAAFLPGITAQERNPSTEPADQPLASEAQWWKDRHAALTKNLKENPCDILFIGDSITQGWTGNAGKTVWDLNFVPYHAADFGISGDRTAQVLARIEDSKLETLREPKVCVIHIGTNNTGHFKAEESPDVTAKGIEAIARKITDAFEETEVILLHIFPRGATSGDAYRSHNEKINALLAQLQIPRVKVVDIGKVFLNPDGTFLPGITGDNLHLTPKGYELWAQVLIPYLNKYFPDMIFRKPEVQEEGKKAA